MCQISTDMLSLMAGAVVASMPSTATIRHAIFTKSALHTPTKSYGTVAATVPCRIEMASASSSNEELRKIAEKYMGKAAYRILLANDTDIRFDDEVVETVSGRIFHVVSAGNNISFSVSRSVVGIEFTGA